MTPNFKKKKIHFHRYERYAFKPDYIVYRCNLPGCQHYMKRDLVAGKECLCNRCGDLMIMDKIAMRLRLPHCKSCTKKPFNPKLSQKVEEKKDVRDKLAEIIAGLETPPN